MILTMVSNTRLDKIGTKLKKSDDILKGELRDLQEWRNSFSSILDYYHKKLKEKVSSGDIVAIAKRIKRIESIRIKLKRFKTMRLSTLQDIAGIRLILKDKSALDRAFAEIRGSQKRHTLKRLDDYSGSPKEDGYRGVHLVYQTDSSKMIEIQLRTQLEHIWATAVEIYGALQFTSFKTGEGKEEWKEFFRYLSSYFAILEKSRLLSEHDRLSNVKIKSKLKKYIKKLQVIERLNAASSGIEVIVNKRSQGRSGKYALLELDLLNGVTKIDIFNKSEVPVAIKEYTQRELAIGPEESKNIVFVNIESVENIQKTYPNYFLNTKKLLELLSKLVLE